MTSNKASFFRSALAMAVGSLALSIPGAADAAFQLRLTDNLGNSVLVQDQDFAPAVGTIADGSAIAGVIVSNVALPGGSLWNVNVTTGLSKPLLGAPHVAEMDLNSVNVSSSGAGSITIELTDTGFSIPVGDARASIAIGGTAGGSVVYDAWFNSSDTMFAQETPIGNLGVFGPGAFSGSAETKILGVLPTYSLTQKIVVTHTAAGQVSSFDAAVQVPEPESLTLLGIGLLGIGLLVRRRTRAGASA